MSGPNLAETKQSLIHTFCAKVSSEANLGGIVQSTNVLNEYYEARGWDLIKGKPLKVKLRELGLEEG
ncbi:aldehyde ferredoxin oxidoreductase C-terminal domain-containing protein [Acidobacteriota bacterium]